MADCIPSASDQLDKIQKMQERLNAVAQSGANKKCSDCCAPYPTWASLLEPANEGGKRMGVLCCFQCYSHHFSLGKDICEVKSIKIAADWKEEDIQVIKETGNDVVNEAYEARLKDLEDAEKEAVFRRKQEDRERFIQDKYKQRIYFSEKICDRAIERRSRQRKRAKGLKSRSPRPTADRRKLPNRTVSLDEELLPTSDRRKTPTRTFSLDEELCCGDRPGLDRSPTPSRDGDRRHLDSKKSPTSRHSGEGRPAPPRRSRSSANADPGERGNSGHPGRPAPPRRSRSSANTDLGGRGNSARPDKPPYKLGQENSRASSKPSEQGTRGNTRPKMQRAASSRDGKCLKKESSLRALDTKLTHGWEKNHKSMSDIMFDFEMDFHQPSVPVRAEASLKGSETIPLSSGHGERRRKKRTTSVPKRRGSCAGRLNPVTKAEERSDSSPSLVNNGVDLPVSSDHHGERRPRKRAENVTSPRKERRTAVIGITGDVGHRLVRSASCSSSSSKENEIPPSSGHGEKRSRTRGKHKGKRPDGPEKADSGIDSTSHHSVRSTSSSAKENEIPSSSGHGEKRPKKRGERKVERSDSTKKSDSGDKRGSMASGQTQEPKTSHSPDLPSQGLRRRALPGRTLSSGSGERNERRGSLGYGQPGDRRGSLGYGQPGERRGSLGYGQPGPSDRRGSLGNGRQRRHRNSLDHRNIPDPVGDQEVELPTAEERQSWNHSKLDKIAARRHKGRLGNSVARLAGYEEDDSLKPQVENQSHISTGDVEPDTQPDVPSREELGYGDDTPDPEEVHEKKKTSWKKKLVKLAKGGLATDKKKGDKAAEALATNNQPPTGTGAMLEPQNATALVA